MWTTLASLPQALFDARAAYAANVNKIYVFGGLDAGSNVLNTTYIYDIATDSWTTGTAMPAARFFPAVAYYGANGKIYVIGGVDGSFLEANQTWEYDPVADTWDTSRTSIPVAMGGSATSIVDQNIYVAGSYGATGGTTFHYRYDILADSWMQMADVPAPVYEAAGAAVGSHTYVVGGGNPAVGAWGHEASSRRSCSKSARRALQHYLHLRYLQQYMGERTEYKRGARFYRGNSYWKSPDRRRRG